MSATSQVITNYQNDFESTVSRYSPMLYRVALSRLRNVEDAEDVVQDALLSAWKYIGQFEGRSRLSTWLTRIVLNAAGMKLRRQPRYEAVSLDESQEGDGTAVAEQLVDTRPGPEATYAREEMAAALHLAIAKISPKLQAAVQLGDLRELSTQEAAEALEISASSLKSRRMRARTALGSLLDEVVGTDADEAEPDTDRRGAVRDRRGSWGQVAHSDAASDCVRRKLRICKVIPG